jgi:hypothetical protein
MYYALRSVKDGYFIRGIKRGYKYSYEPYFKIKGFMDESKACVFCGGVNKKYGAEFKVVEVNQPRTFKVAA